MEMPANQATTSSLRQLFLVQSTKQMQFITNFKVRYNIATKSLVYYAANHPNWII